MSYANTALLLPGIGADASTVFDDFSRHDRTGTIRASVQIDTAQSKFYGSSLYMPATTASGSTQPGLVYTGISPGAGLWTVRGWMRTADNTKYAFLFDTRETGSVDTNDCTVYFDGVSQRLVFVHNPAGSTVVTSATTPIVNDTWYHIEATRDGSNDVRLFLDGNLEATVNTTRNFNPGWLFVGNWNTSTSNSTPDHWINDFEFIPGDCLHTASFTPPGKRFAPVAGTITDDAGNPVERRIWVIPRAAESRMFTGLSSAVDGTYSIDAPDYECTRVVLDDDAGTTYNDLIDRIAVSV